MLANTSGTQPPHHHEMYSTTQHVASKYTKISNLFKVYPSPGALFIIDVNSNSLILQQFHTLIPQITGIA
jgi:hypothetical protein